MSYQADNIFAKIIKGELPAIKIYEDEQTFAMMDIMPQSKGHVLVLTKEPAKNLLEISSQGIQACIATAHKLAPAIMAATKADGLIMTQFNEAIAGQTIFHLHVHLVPCYKGVALKTHSNEKADTDELQALAQQIMAHI